MRSELPKIDIELGSSARLLVEPGSELASRSVSTINKKLFRSEEVAVEKIHRITLPHNHLESRKK